MQPHDLERPWRRTLSVCAVTSVAFLLALWAELALAESAGSPFQFVPFSLAAVVSAGAGGLIPGAVTVLLAAAASDYVLLAPGSLLTVDRAAQGYALAAFVGGWLAFSWWIDGVRRQRQEAVEGGLAAARTAAHARRVLQLTAALAQSRTPDAVIEAAVQEPMHALGADAGLFLLVAESGASCTVARAVAHDLDASASRPIPLTRRSPVSEAIARRAPVIVASRLAWRAEFPETVDEPERLPYEATVAVPLVVRGRAAAVIVLDFRTPRTFTADDEDLLVVLGSRAAVSLDRTWQYELAQRARLEAESLRQRADQELTERQKTEQALRSSETRYRLLTTRTIRLHELTAALSEAVTLRAVAKAVVQHGNVVVGATAGDVSLLVPPSREAPRRGDGRQGGHDTPQFEVLYAEPATHGASEPLRFEGTEGLCATDAVRTRRPIFIGSWPEWQDRYWQSASAAADAAYVSSAIVPLVVESAPIGIMSFHFSVPVNFDDEYQALLVSVAQHCAQALDRARLYESAERARLEAENANRLKDDFLSIVSHELRTPLNAVLGWASMLRKGSMDASLAPRAVQSICDNANRQAKLIDELLDVTRIVAGHTTLDMQDIRIAHLIGGVAESFTPTAASRQIDLRVGNDTAAAVIVRGDLRRLEQVLFNLLSNALKFTPAGGRILLESREIDGMVELRVSDTGIGIEPEFLPYAFDRFRQQDSTTTRSFGGLGLGLSITKQLVEAHGGSITANSPGKDQGATFSVRLPVARHEEERARPIESPQRERDVPAAPRLEGIRVLIVDDDADARELMGHALRTYGATVALADSAAAALTMLNQSAIDVLLADIAMPDEDGCALIRKIRASGDARVSSLPAAAVTAHAREADRHEAYAAGFQFHLAKPIEPTALAHTVEQLVHSRQRT